MSVPASSKAACLYPIRTLEDLRQIDPESIIDLTDEVNANWRDILRANPDDPRFKAPPGISVINLGRAIGDPLSILVKKERRNKA